MTVTSTAQRMGGVFFSKRARTTTTARVLCCALLTLAAGGCIKKQSGAEAEAAEEEKSFIVGRWAFRRLEAVDAAIAEGDTKTALEKLAELRDSEQLNDHERALTLQKYGGMHAEQRNYPEAIKAFRQTLALDALPSAATRTVQYNLGQLYAITEQPGPAVELLELWASGEKAGPPREIQLMLANALMELEQFERALVYVEALATASDEPSENLVLMELAIHVELQHDDRVLELLTVLVERFPKPMYWMQLANAYSQREDNRRAVAVMELMHRQGFLTTSAEIMRLAQHYAYLSLPVRAARLLEAEVADGRVEPTTDNLEFLANSWIEAREPEKAILVLQQAAEQSDTGVLAFRLGQLLLQKQRWSEAAAALRLALSKGGIREVAVANVSLGNALYELGQRSAARAAFKQAAAADGEDESGDRWLRIMDREDESCVSGREAACKLIPGR